MCHAIIVVMMTDTQPMEDSAILGFLEKRKFIINTLRDRIISSVKELNYIYILFNSVVD